MSEENVLVTKAIHEQALKFIEIYSPENFHKAIEYLAFLALNGKVPNKLSYDEKIIVDKFNTKAHELGLISENFGISPSVQKDLRNFFTIDDNERISKNDRDVLISVFNNVKAILARGKFKSLEALLRENADPQNSAELQKSEYVRKFITRNKKHIANWQKKKDSVIESNPEPAKTVEESIPKATQELSKREKNFGNWGRL